MYKKWKYYSRLLVREGKGRARDASFPWSWKIYDDSAAVDCFRLSAISWIRTAYLPPSSLTTTVSCHRIIWITRIKLTTYFSGFWKIVIMFKVCKMTDLHSFSLNAWRDFCFVGRILMMSTKPCWCGAM